MAKEGSRGASARNSCQRRSLTFQRFAACAGRRWCAVYLLLECGEPFTVVTAEEAVDALVGVKAEELSDDLEGEDLSIRELGCGSATSDASPFETVVDEAEERQPR